MHVHTSSSLELIMNVEIIMAEKIKPSVPTPTHLRNFKLCILDQLIPASYAPIVIYYHNQNNPNNSRVLEKLALLKHSLSETLSHFFPLAGTLTNDFSVDCDDQGACFTTAKVKNHHLSDFLECPDLKLIAKFLPCGLDRKVTDRVTNIQATEFKCGGISIGICISHRVLDGAGLSTFLKSWSSLACPSQGREIAFPDFSASTVFPANDLWLKDASMVMWGSLMKKGSFVTRRFVFDKAAIEVLKDRATGGSGICPTRVEMITGFIWKCAMAACEKRFGSKRPSLITHLVNIRQRFVPKFSKHAIGNLVWVASAGTAGKEAVELPELVGEVRKGISKIEGGFLEKLRGCEGLKMMQKCLDEIVCESNVDHFGFTSWCKLGFYEVDFGWGMPVWVSSIDASGSFFMNLVVLIDGRYGDGVEAWVTLDEQEMDVLEENQEFQAFTSFNPNPLNGIGSVDT